MMACLVFLISSCSQTDKKPRILVFSKTAGYVHESIPQGIDAIVKLGVENGFDVDTTQNAAIFTEDSLKKYAAVVFLSTTGDVLNQYQEADFERFIQAGGGYVGIHSASDTEYDWGWYGRMAGAYFLNHPGMNDTFPNVQPGIIDIVDKDHSTTEFLPERWERTDEWYSFKNLNNDVNVLMNIDEDSYNGGADMGQHPMAWYHDYDGGRAFYTAFGHTKESFAEELFLQHLLKGIEYAIGENKLDYSKAKTLRVPEEDRFKKTALVTGEFFEPTEMTILPNLDVLIAQRRGEIKLYKNGDSTVTDAGFLDVYFQSGLDNVNAEEGVLGIQADPDFENNNFVFIFYSPADTSVNRLSRFKFENDKLNMDSEKVILEFYSQRLICCHTGGSIAFDKDGLLYVSTGDNSTPFNEPDQPYITNGYAPLDDREGHEQYDAARSAGNPNDLRGKILRIRVNEDGSYDIPEGNLYPKGQEGTKPEIYVQGNRNPYRISIDQKNNYLYWGEVGPDAKSDSLDTRGPMGYDEINQAREAGFFGWPFFVANNIPYVDFDYGTGQSGDQFDASNPINASRNNTGIKELPPAQPAFIWYPYTSSSQFPQTGTGGRNAMAGPVYYKDMFDAETRMPDYYDKKLIIYDWVRGWIKAVTLKENGDYDKMEPFMAGTKFNAPIDMEMGPDGKLYILEYGNGWFTQNPDAGLSRIDFNAGNRYPRINAITVDKTSGSIPLTIEAKVDAMDPERGELTYFWNIGNGVRKVTSEPVLTYTFDEIGDYSIEVEVSDSEKQKVKSEAIEIYAGNEAPVVSIDLKGNKSFYFPGKEVEYSVSIEDKDDPSASQDLDKVFVSADYLEGSDLAEASVGHKVATDAVSGANMVKSLDCIACHKENEKSIGPSYVEVANKYHGTPGAQNYLVEKIINGGSGVWGEAVMPAHLEMKESDVRRIASWILSLSEEGKNQKSLSSSGKLKPTLNKPVSENGVFVLSASYTDKGGNNIKPLTGNTSVALRHNKMSFAAANNLDGFTAVYYTGMPLMQVPQARGSFSLENIDLTNIASIEVAGALRETLQYGYTFELRLDAPDGRKIGESKLMPGKNYVARDDRRPVLFNLEFPIESVNDGEFHDIYLVGQAVDELEESRVFLVSMQFNSK